MEDTNSLKTEVELIKRDVSRIETLIEKMDVLASEINNLNRSMALQDQRISLADITAEAAKQKTRENEQEELRFRKELYGKLDEMTKLIQQQKDVARGSLSESIALLQDDINVKFGAMEKRISVLENWKWWIMGIGVTIVAAFSYVWKTMTGT